MLSNLGKAFGAVCLLLAAGCSEQSVVATADALPEFSMRGASTSTPLPTVQTVFEGCEATENGDSICKFKEPSIAGEYALYQNVVFDQQGLKRFYLSFDSQSFEALASGLVQAYGEPCENETSELQNAFGATFEQIKLTWCFDSARLLLERYAEKITESSLFLNTDRDITIAAKPFTPDDI